MLFKGKADNDWILSPSLHLKTDSLIVTENNNNNNNAFYVFI